MVTLDLGQLATILGIAGTLGGVIVMGYKLFKRFERIERKVEHSEQLHAVLIIGLYACLDGLHQQGCNGEVTKALNELQKHLAKSAG